MSNFTILTRWRSLLPDCQKSLVDYPVQWIPERVGEVVAGSLVEFEESPGFRKTKLAG